MDLLFDNEWPNGEGMWLVEGHTHLRVVPVFVLLTGSALKFLMNSERCAEKSKGGCCELVECLCFENEYIFEKRCARRQHVRWRCGY